METLGERLRLERLLMDVGQRAVAQLAGISQPELSNIERGFKQPSPELVERIREAIEKLAAATGR